MDTPSSLLVVSLSVLALGPLAMFATVKLIIRALAWARRRRAEAAAMMTGQYLEHVIGGQLPAPEWDFVDWLGQQIDEWIGHTHESPSADHQPSDGPGAGHPHGCTHDAGGLCSHGDA